MLRRHKPWNPPRKPLKKTPLAKRKKGLAKVSTKKRAYDQAAKGMFDEFIETHTSCAVCGWFAGQGRHGRYGRHLETHHLAKGTARKHDRRLLLRLCSRCHAHLHGGGCFDDAGNRLPPLTDAHMMQAKYESDRRYYSPKAVAEAYGWKSLPKSWRRKPIPEAFRNGA